MPVSPISRPSGTRLIIATLLVGQLTAGPVMAQQPTNAQADPTGEWLVEKKLARIKIADCDGKMWGVVSWEARPGIDRKNPDPNLRTRPTLDMPILLGMTQSKANQWDGQIYNSEDGHTYSASITLLNPAMLRVQGCFLGFLCGGENWTRVEPQELPGDALVQPPKKNGQVRGTQPNNRKAAGNVADPGPDDVCLRLFGTPGLPHQGGLK